MRNWLFVLALASMTAGAEEPVHHHEASPASDASIVVTINPEARVSAVLGALPPSRNACESSAELKIKVLNQGYVTAPLRARIVGDSGPVVVNMDAVKLSGGPEESRTLHLTHLGSDPTDVTIAFSLDNNVGDLGGRDRIHLLLRCAH